METSELRAYFKSNPGKLTEQILQGTFKPLAYKEGLHPKRQRGATSLGDTHGNRPLCATGNSLSTEARNTKRFLWITAMGSDPTGTAGKAVRRAMEHIREGYEWVIDIDLRKVLLIRLTMISLVQLLSRRIRDGRVISLIHKFLPSAD